MAYEIIERENGDVLARFDDESEALTGLRAYLNENRHRHPLLEHDTMLVEVYEDDDGRAHGHRIISPHGETVGH